MPFSAGLQHPGRKPPPTCTATHAPYILYGCWRSDKGPLGIFGLFESILFPVPPQSVFFINKHCTLGKNVPKAQGNLRLGCGEFLAVICGFGVSVIFCAQPPSKDEPLPVRDGVMPALPTVCLFCCFAPRFCLLRVRVRATRRRRPRPRRSRTLWIG